jgi:hypothetical protein
MDAPEPWGNLKSMRLRPFLQLLKRDEVFGADLKDQPLSKCQVSVVKAVKDGESPAVEEVKLVDAKTFEDLVGVSPVGPVFIYVTLPVTSGGELVARQSVVSCCHAHASYYLADL